MSLVITSRNVVLPSHHEACPATIHVDLASGKISRVQLLHGSRADCPDDATFTDYGDLYILPGLVEYVRIYCPLCALIAPRSAHVHLNEPGRTDWEGFATGTQAAASGGVTVVVDMPLNSIPPTTTVQNLQVKRQAAQGQCWTDVGFWGGVIPGNQVYALVLTVLRAPHFVLRVIWLISSRPVCEDSSVSRSRAVSRYLALQHTRMILNRIHTGVPVRQRTGPTLSHEGTGGTRDLSPSTK